MGLFRGGLGLDRNCGRSFGDRAPRSLSLHTHTQFGALFDTFKDVGGQAIEVITGSHTVPQYQEYAQIARHYDFLASCGSDFHSSKESKIEFGSLPPLPADLKPVWKDLI